MRCKHTANYYRITYLKVLGGLFVVAAFALFAAALVQWNPNIKHVTQASFKDAIGGFLCLAAALVSFLASTDA